MLKDHKQQVKVRLTFINKGLLLFYMQDREKKVSKFEQSGLTEEQLLAEQEKLFAASRARFQGPQ